MRSLIAVAIVLSCACSGSPPEPPRQDAKSARLREPQQPEPGPPRPAPPEAPREPSPPVAGYPKWVITPRDPVNDPAVLPVPTHQVAPVYPAEAMKARPSGEVMLRLTIERDGRISEIRVLKPLPFGLSEAAVAAASQWRYRPGYDRAGRPIRSYAYATIRFYPPEK